MRREFAKAQERFNSRAKTETSGERMDALVVALAILKEANSPPCSAGSWKVDFFVDLTYPFSEDWFRNEAEMKQRIREVVERYNLSWLVPEMEETIKKCFFLRSNALYKDGTNEEPEACVERKLRTLESLLEDFSALMTRTCYP